MSYDSCKLSRRPDWLFRQCSYEIAGAVAGILNKSFSAGQVPDSWLCAMVTPVPKVPQPQKLADFRPISETPIVSQIAEKIVVSRYLRPAIPRENLHDQFAFKPTGSTTSCLLYTSPSPRDRQKSRMPSSA